MIKSSSVQRMCFSRTLFLSCKYNIWRDSRELKNKKKKKNNWDYFYMIITKTHLMPRKVGKKNFILRNRVKNTLSILFVLFDTFTHIWGATYGRKTNWKLTSILHWQRRKKQSLPCKFSSPLAKIQNHHQSMHTIQ